MEIKLQDYVDKIVEEFTTGRSSVILNSYRRGHITQEAFLENVKEFIKSFGLSEANQKAVLDAYSEFEWGYDILKPLIDAEDIFDIHINSYNQIRVKQLVGRKTIRVTSEVQFESPDHFMKFINVLIIRNKINLSDQDAQQSFVDKDSHPDYRLRGDISTGLVTCDREPFLHIRKMPKKKKILIDLLADGMITPELMEVCKEAAKGAMLISGESGAGKSIFMNAEIEEVPFDNNIAIIQEDDELFSDVHPDVKAFRIIEKKGTDGIKYDFHDHARMLMKRDRDFLIFSEVKGREAADVFTAAITGHNPWLSLHAGSNRAAVYQLANLVHIATGYALTDVFRMLSFVPFTLFHLTDFEIDEVTKIAGWDEEKQEIIFKDILKKGERK